MHPSDATPASRNKSFDEWIQSIRRTCGHFDASPGGERFSGRLDDLSAGSMRMSLAGADRSLLYRSREHISRMDEHCFFLVLQMRGQGQVEQGGQRARLSAGDLAMLDGTQPFSVGMSDRSMEVSLILPAPLVERSMRRGRIACARAIAGHSTLGLAASRLIITASRQSRTGLDRQESDALLEGLMSLLRPAVGMAENAQDGHERMFQRACEFIDLHLSDEALTAQWIAQSVGVSVRGLYRLFAGQGMVLSQYIKHRRLDACAQALRGGEGADMKIAALAYAWGFADASHFSVAFKQRFGEAPSTYRQRFLLHGAAPAATGR